MADRTDSDSRLHNHHHLSVTPPPQQISKEDQKKYIKRWTGVEVGYMAAKFLKKTNIERYGLVELACEVGLDIKESIRECPNWDAEVFSDEEIKYAMHKAYTSYVIGKKLLDMH
ncbi:uncharacterized protein LOC115979344 [Quercus lobata]|nr:uncharacterized protein LOC115979344 [Quercus lobata]